MAERKTQRSISAHRDSRNATIGATLGNAVFRFDKRNKFLQEEIAVTHASVGGIDVERSPALWSGDQKFADFMLPTKIVYHSPSATVEECLLVVAEAMQKVENRIMLGRLFAGTGVIASGDVNAVVHRMLKDAAAHRVAVDAALGAGNGNPK